MQKFTISVLLLFILFPCTILFAQCPSGDVKLETQAEVDKFAIDFPNCDKISGKLEIAGSLHTNIINLSSLSKIKEIEGRLSIGSTQVSRADFKNLKLIGGDLFIGSNFNLEEINLINLTTVNGDIIYTENFKIKTVNLPNLIAAKIKRLHFVHNFELTNIDMCKIKKVRSFTLAKNSILKTMCFDNLEEIEKFSISENDQLEHLNAFKNTTILHSIYIDRMSRLINLDALESTTTLENLSVVRNASLTNLNGLKNLTELKHSLFIHNNPKLTDCSGLCNLFNNNGYTGNNAQINNNPSACSTRNEMSSNCNALSIDEELLNNLILYPNPTANDINIQFAENQNVESISIYDVLGKEIFTKKVEASETNITLRPNLSSGVYFLKINSDKGQFSKKIIIK